MPTYEPGVYETSADDYHAHPALSSSGARKLLPPSCPALFHYERSNPVEPTTEMEFGSVAHDLLLGNGNAYEVLSYDNYRTKESQEKAKALRAEGRIPILDWEFRRAEAMVSVLRAHPIAGHLFTGGAAEKSLFWVDPTTGVNLRARIDYMKLDHLPPLIVDYKSCTSAALDKIPKSVADYGYHIQAAFYIEAVKRLKLADDPAFLNVWQERKPPFLVTVTQMPVASLLIGADRVREAIELFDRCTKTGRWPGHSDQVEAIGVPYWVENAWRNGY